MPANLENSAVATGLQKVSILILKKGNAKECSNYCTTALISHASKVMLKILQARLQKYVNCELGDVQAIFGKARGNRDQIANICWIIEKAKQLQKKSALLTMPKSLTMWITTNCGKFFKRWEYQTTWPVSWEICTQVQFTSVQSLSRFWLFVTLWGSSGLPVHHQFQSLPKLMPTELVMPSNHLILYRLLLLLPSIFPQIRVFSNELALRIR